MFTSLHLLLRKTLGGFRFVLNKLPHYDLVLKLDDDLEIRFLHQGHSINLHIFATNCNMTN